MRSRLVRGLIWFTLSILPAELPWLRTHPESPHAIVKDDEGPVLEIDQIVASLASAP